MKQLIFALIVVLVQTAFGLQFDGDIVKTNGKNYIFLKSENKAYLLNGNSALVANYLTKLNDGDFVSVEAHKNSTMNTINVANINYVGLRDLLGIWSGDDNRCYSFTSHTDFSVTRRYGDTCGHLEKTDYTYLINPNPQQWVMLVAGHFDSYLGDVSIVSKKNVEISLYDSETGGIIRRLVLRKKIK